MGTFTAIVPARKEMTFAAAQACRVDNWSNQYAHLVEPDIYILPNQSGRIILLGGISKLTLVFEGPPNVAQAAPINNQICQVETYESKEAGGTQGPFEPNPGLINPIGLDDPLHLHHVTGTHLHAHTGTHVHNPHAHAHTTTHDHLEGSHLHGHSGTHAHGLSIQAGGAIVTAVGLDAGGQLVAAAGPNPVGTVTQAAAPGNTDNTNLGNTGLSAPGSTDNANVPAAAPGNTNLASSGDTDLENTQHTHP